MRCAARPDTACRTCCNRLRPASRCNTFGTADFMRVPLPAAMMTMFRAMPMSCSRAWIIGVLLAALALLGGCTTARFAYGQAPALAYWWLDGYIDFDDAQETVVRDAIADWFRWPRPAQIPDYAELLGG